LNETQQYSDFHLHTEYSFDSKEKLENVCAFAIEKGLSAIAVTNHYDHDGIEEGLYEEYFFERDAENILYAKEKYKDRLQIFMGLEIGQPHTMNDKKLSKIEGMEYEFIIGSLHNLKNCFDFYYLDYKRTTPLYDRAIYKKYLFELMEIADLGFIDTIGHITYPERYMKECGKEFVYSEFEDEFFVLFEKMVKNGIALEINTSGLRQGLCHTMPKTDILTLYRKAGGEKVTVGSDAHCALQVGEGVKETFEKIRELGFLHINEIRRKTK